MPSRSARWSIDPHTGEVLAWASVPGYDANNYAAQARQHPDCLQDPIVSQVYEPGSVMKMFTAAARQDRHGDADLRRHDRAHAVRTTDIHDSDHKSMGRMFSGMPSPIRATWPGRRRHEARQDRAKACAQLYNMWKPLASAS